MKKSIVIYPTAEKALLELGQRIKLARLRRELKASLVAERAGISRITLSQIEKGSPSVSIGAYACVLHAIGGLESDLDLVAKDDEMGRLYQDAGLLAKRRVRK